MDSIVASQCLLYTESCLHIHLCIYRFQGMLRLQTLTGNAKAGFLALYGETLMPLCVLFLILLQAYICNIVPHSLLMLSFTILKLTLITFITSGNSYIYTSSQPLLTLALHVHILLLDRCS